VLQQHAADVDSRYSYVDAQTEQCAMHRGTDSDAHSLLLSHDQV
jgi:hypothetical protein